MLLGLFTLSTCGILLWFNIRTNRSCTWVINFYNRGLQSVLGHCTHPIILYWNQALTFRRSSLCWCICGFTFNKISLQPGIHDQIMGSLMPPDLCSNSWTVSWRSSFIPFAKGLSDRNDSSHVQEQALGNYHLRKRKRIY